MGFVYAWDNMKQGGLNLDGDGLAPGGSILDLKESKPRVDFSPSAFSDGIVDIAIRKHRCMSPWCPCCFKLYVAPVIARCFQDMNWQAVRMITLTIDREQFSDGEAAYEHMKKTGAIAAMCRNFVRFAGKEIKKWMWILEWHADGYPHWHLVIEMRQSGKQSMIGQEIIHKYWPYGRIREGYVNSQRHWKNISGYLQKRGYLSGGDDKGHQVELPEWAKNYGHRIKRRGSMRMMKLSSYKVEKSNVVAFGEKFRCVDECARSYKIKLEACGASTKINILTGIYCFPEINLSIPYHVILKEVGDLQYCKGLGFCKRVDWVGLRAFINMYSEFMQEGCSQVFDSALNGDLKVMEGR